MSAKPARRGLACGRKRSGCETVSALDRRRHLRAPKCARPVALHTRGGIRQEEPGGQTGQTARISFRSHQGRGPGSRSQRRPSVSPSRPLVWHRELPRLRKTNEQKKPTNKLRDLGVAAGEPSLSALEPESDFGYRRPPNPGFSLLTH